MRTRALLWTCLMMLLGLPLSSKGVLVAYEGFDIAPGAGALDGASGATSFGWTNTWTPGVANGIAADGLGYTNGAILQAVGGAAQLSVPNGGSFRHFAPAYPTSTGTYWISFLGRVPAGATYAGVSYVNPFNEFLFMGDLSGTTNWGGQTYGTGGVITNSASPVSTLVFFVARVDFNRTTSNDDVRVWLNPSIGGETPPDDASATLALIGTDFSGSANAANASRIRLQQGSSGNNAIFDEVRVGTTWLDVTPSSPIGIPVTNAAQFTTIGRASGFVSLDITNLTAGATNELLRAYDFSDAWETAATFTASTDATNVLDTVSSSNTVHYRIISR